MQTLSKDRTDGRLPLFVCLMLGLICLLPASKVLSLFATILFLVLIAYYVWTKFSTTLRYAVFIFAVCSNVIGVFVCEYAEVYLTNLNTYSSFEGSLPLIIFSRSLFLAIIFSLDNRRKTNNDSVDVTTWNITGTPRIFLGIACFGVLFLCLLSFLHVAPEPSFLFGYDRFQYARLISGVWALIASYLPYLIIIPILGIRFGYKKTGISTVIIYCVYLFWIGTKFSTFFIIFCYFMLVYHDRFSDISNAMKKKIILSLAFVLVLFLAFTVFAYGASGHSVEGFLYQRLAQQGELWWRTYSLLGSGIWIDNNQLQIEFEAIFNDKSIAESVYSVNGIYGIMRLCAPREIVESFLTQGARFTEAGYAMPYVIFGSMGPILFSLVMSIVTYLTQTVFYSSISHGRIFASIAMSLLTGYVQVALSMFLFSQFLTALGIILICFSTLSCLVHSSHRLDKVGGANVFN